MKLAPWLANLFESAQADAEFHFRVILKSGNEMNITYYESNDEYGTEDELTDGNYMIDTRSIAAIEVTEVVESKTLSS